MNRHLLECSRTLPTATLLAYEALCDTPVLFWSACLTALGLEDRDMLEHCVDRSSKRINARSSYQIGALDTWSDEEQEFHRTLARPLEVEIYESTQ